jgi:hypothetical protein
MPMPPKPIKKSSTRKTLSSDSSKAEIVLQQKEQDEAGSLDSTKNISKISTKETVEQLQTADTVENPDSTKPNPDPIFQGIGIIAGEVLKEDGLYSVLLNSKQYPLLPKKPRTISALNKEIETTKNPVQRLIVYPRVIHFPDRNKPYQLMLDSGKELDIRY